MTGPIVLVLGGARSGKSEAAERMVAAHGPITYVATAGRVVGDADWDSRIAAHRNRRPESWATVELDGWSGDLAACLAATPTAVLVDSLGTWVARHHDFVVDAAALVAVLRQRTSATVIVSEEVGLGVHPETELGRRFRDALGQLNVAVAAAADTVLLVVAGRTLELT